MYCKIVFYIIFLCLSCKENAGTNNAESSALIPAGKILDSIQLKVTDVTVSRTLLLNEDGATVSSTHITEVNKPLKLRVFIDNGWVVKNGKVSVGAYQKIETFKNQTILEETDLFENIGPISTEEAKMITIAANVNKIYKKRDSFIVSFRVWDKNGTGQIEGSYKMVVTSQQ